MKIVIDTNVLVSAAIRNNDTIHKIIAKCRKGEIELALSKALIQELGRVLHKPRLQKIHRKDDSQISQYIKELVSFSDMVSGSQVVEISPDPKDNMIFACAVEAQADYIISGDIRHVLSIPVFQGVKTISPIDFVEKILHPR